MIPINTYDELESWLRAGEYGEATLALSDNYSLSSVVRDFAHSELEAVCRRWGYAVDSAYRSSATQNYAWMGNADDVLQVRVRRVGPSEAELEYIREQQRRAYEAMMRLRRQAAAASLILLDEGT
jgi:hypothetical protein